MKYGHSSKNEKVSTREMEEMANDWDQGYTHILRVWLKISNNFNIWNILEELNLFVIPFPFE